MYAICEYPEIFGGAACLSTHWLGLQISPKNDRVAQALLIYLAAKLPDPKAHRIYFDRGDKTLDAGYPPFQDKADKILALKGFDADNSLSRVFPGADHTEKSWKARLDVPLIFLFGKR
jgi:hypothetical protein